MKSKLYSYALVGIQFGCIVFLVMQQSQTILSNPFACGVFLLGTLVGVYTIRHNQNDNFNIIPEIKPHAKLITSGAYAYVRHPMYFSVWVMMFGFFLANPTLNNGCIFGFLLLSLFLKAHKEEKLWLETSEEYASYRQKVKAIIPFVI